MHRCQRTDYSEVTVMPSIFSRLKRITSTRTLRIKCRRSFLYQLSLMFQYHFADGDDVLTSTYTRELFEISVKVKLQT